MAFDKNMKRNFKVYRNNTVSMYGRYVGRIDRSSYGGQRGKTTFFTASGDVFKTGYDTPHEIDAPLYIDGPADWNFNDDFIAEVEAIIS